MHKKIKTFANACKKLGISTELPNVEAIPKHLQKQVIADYKLVVIAEALNDGWTPDWNNSYEYKYYPWFSMSSSGSGFSCNVCVCGHSLTYVGSHQCYKQGSADRANMAKKYNLKRALVAKAKATEKQRQKMKRINNVFESVISLDNLRLADKRAQRGTFPFQTVIVQENEHYEFT